MLGVPELEGTRELSSAEPKSQPTDLCISINAWGSKGNHHVRLRQVGLFSSFK